MQNKTETINALVRHEARPGCQRCQAFLDWWQGLRRLQRQQGTLCMHGLTMKTSGREMCLDAADTTANSVSGLAEKMSHQALLVTLTQRSLTLCTAASLSLPASAMVCVKADPALLDGAAVCRANHYCVEVTSSCLRTAFDWQTPSLSVLLTSSVENFMLHLLTQIVLKLVSEHSPMAHHMRP